MFLPAQRTMEMQFLKPLSTVRCFLSSPTCVKEKKILFEMLKE